MLINQASRHKNPDISSYKATEGTTAYTHFLSVAWLKFNFKIITCTWLLE